MGTELARRGVPTPSPLWSAAALLAHPQVVQQIHVEYVQAGADILVANTFRTNPRTLKRAGLAARGTELTRVAVNLARKAMEGAARPVYVAASVGPVEDCYSPELTPHAGELRAEHEAFAQQLKAAHPDFVWIETMGTLSEAVIAAQASANAGLDFCISFVTREDGALLGGESLAGAIEQILPLRPLAIGLNCVPPAGITQNLKRLVDDVRFISKAQAASIPRIAAYAHIANERPLPGWSYAEDADPIDYLGIAQEWLTLGADIVGGCCGTQPTHIRRIARDFRHKML